MNGKFLILVSLPIFGILFGCSVEPKILVSCEKTKSNYILRWEIYPEGKLEDVEIFKSNTDTTFSKHPIAKFPLDDYIASVSDEDNDSTRNFFRIKAGNSYSGIISNRTFHLDSVNNLRDLGGYLTNDDRQVRWGKIYRSADLSILSDRDIDIIKSLGLKTIIDLRDLSKSDTAEIHNHSNYYHIPVYGRSDGFSSLLDSIIHGSYERKQAMAAIREIYQKTIDECTEDFALLFDLLSDKNNYPLLFHCHLGKDITGITSYLLLSILDVPQNIIEEDYLLSNRLIKRQPISDSFHEIPDAKREALMSVRRADISYLRHAISYMKKKSGSVEGYIENELKVTPEKKKRIKEILLYSNI